MAEKLFNKYILILLFSGALILGLSTYKNYGMSWDENSQHSLGIITYNYLFHGNDSLLHDDNNVYGVAFELPLVVVEKALRLTDTRDIFLMRHLLTHLFFLLGALCFFLLIDYIYRNKLLATLGFLLLMVNPLIYGHSFFNSKDIPFMSMFMICFLVVAVAFKKHRLDWYIALGMGCGLLTNMRIMGILLIGSIWLFFAIDYYNALKDKEARKKILKYALVFTFTTFLVLYVTWPYLYHNPVQNFINAFKRMSKYPWEGSVLFWGKIYKSTAIPQYYGISWFCISNPLLYLGLGLVGIILLAVNFFKEPKKFIFDKIERNQLLFAFCFAEPLLAVFVLHSVLYDAWRQLYFIYPPFILLAIFGINYALKTKIKIPVLIIMLAGIGYMAVYMVENYPFEHIYFNEFAKNTAPEYMRRNFEMDYWGTSYRKAFEYILQDDKAPTVKIAANDFVSRENTWLLPLEERKRIKFEDTVERADYFASYYRTNPGDYNISVGKEVFNIKVLNSRIMTVFKINKGE